MTLVCTGIGPPTIDFGLEPGLQRPPGLADEVRAGKVVVIVDLLDQRRGLFQTTCILGGLCKWTNTGAWGA